MTQRLAAMATRKRRYEERRRKGLCNYCDAPSLPGLITCEYHRWRNMKKRREEKKKVKS